MSATAAQSQHDQQDERRRVVSLAEAADLHLQQGRYDEAESLLNEALAIAADAFGKDDLAVATLLNNLGVVHKYQGRFAEAVRAYRRALPIMVSVLGPEHTEVATLYHNLGRLEHARGRVCSAGGYQPSDHDRFGRAADAVGGG